MKRILLKMFTISILAGMVSCAVGRKMTFTNEQAEPGYKITYPVMVVFQDKRNEVLSGKWKPSLCGHNNSTVQISYEILTNSGKPLAYEFAESVNAALIKMGSNSSALNVTPHTAMDSILQAFKETNKDRLLFFTIYKWESRGTPLFSTIRYEVIYSLKLAVFNHEGELLAADSTSNTVTKEQGAATSMKKMQEMADTVFRNQVIGLYNNEAVKKSLLQ
jgi:hypothetical protein